MIFVESKLKVIDNSGATLVKCIKLLGHFGKAGRLGSLVLIVLRGSLASKNTTLTKKVYSGLVVQTKYPIYRLDGSYLKFAENSAVFLTSTFKFMSTRVLKPLVKELGVKFSALVLKAKLCL